MTLYYCELAWYDSGMRKLYKLIKYLLLLFLLLIAVLVIFTVSRTPSNTGNWQPQFQVLPSIELMNDIVSIKNVRDFRWNPDDTVAKVQYLDKNYQLSQFKNAWYGISHFGENGLAHVLLSFEFESENATEINDYLVVSIEARLQESDVDGYSPIAGLFGAYTQAIVLSTEQDVIGLRTHVRGEPLYLYKLDVPEIYTKPLLLNFLRKAQVLNYQAEFYNSIIDNCMTGMLSESHQFKGFASWLDKRILLPGNSDELAYELKYINTSKPFSQVRKEALINPDSTELDDPEFSRKIRL